MKTEFIKFLKERRLYAKWVRNFKEVRRMGLQYERYDSVSKFLDKCDPMKYVISGFWWYKSTEGGVFWEDVCKQWIKYYNENRIY